MTQSAKTFKEAFQSQNHGTGNQPLHHNGSCPWGKAVRGQLRYRSNPLSTKSWISKHAPKQKKTCTYAFGRWYTLVSAKVCFLKVARRAAGRGSSLPEASITALITTPAASRVRDSAKTAHNITLESNVMLARVPFFFFQISFAGGWKLLLQPERTHSEWKGWWK